MKPFFMDERRRFRNNFKSRKWDREEREALATRRSRRSNCGLFPKPLTGKPDLSQFAGMPVKLNGVDRIDLPDSMSVEIANDGNRIFFYPKEAEKINGRSTYDAARAMARLPRFRVSTRGRKRCRRAA